MKTLLATIAALMLSACAPPERRLPPTELPKRPASATLPCEALTDDEIKACIRDEQSREACRKLDVNCARYKNLQSFVRRTWEGRDGK